MKRAFVCNHWVPLRSFANYGQSIQKAKRDEAKRGFCLPHYSWLIGKPKAPEWSGQWEMTQVLCIFLSLYVFSQSGYQICLFSTLRDEGRQKREPVSSDLKPSHFNAHWWENGKEMRTVWHSHQSNSWTSSVGWGKAHYGRMMEFWNCISTVWRKQATITMTGEGCTFNRETCLCRRSTQHRHSTGPVRNCAGGSGCSKPRVLSVSTQPQALAPFCILFAKFKLYGDDELTVEPQLVSPFEEILLIGNKKGQKNSYSTFSDFFSLKSSSKNLLVGLVGLEPMTSTMSTMLQ